MFNVGGSQPIAHRDLVQMLIEEAGAGSVRFVPWPEDKKRIDIGSFYTDSTRFRNTTGWTARTDLRAGLAKTLAFYRAHFAEYAGAPLR